jgi:hypothetical protein
MGKYQNLMVKSLKGELGMESEEYSSFHDTPVGGLLS